MDVIPFMTSPMVLFWFSHQDSVNIPALLSFHSVKTFSSSQSASSESRLEVHKKLGEDTASTADSNRAKRYFMPHDIVLGSKKSEKEGRSGARAFVMFLMGFVFPTFVCWGPTFLELDKHLPVIGCGKLISYFALLAQSKFSHFSPSDSLPHPLAEQSVCTHGGDLPASWGQTTTAAFCAFSFYHHKSAVLAHDNWFKIHTEDLFFSLLPNTSVSALMQEVLSQWLNFLFVFVELPEARLAHFCIFISYPEWHHLPSTYQLSPPNSGNPWTCWGSQMRILELLEQGSQRGCGISAKTGGFQLFTGQAHSANWFYFQVKCYSDIDYLLRASHNLNYWYKQ